MMNNQNKNVASGSWIKGQMKRRTYSTQIELDILMHCIIVTAMFSIIRNYAVYFLQTVWTENIYINIIIGTIFKGMMIIGVTV